MHRRDSSRTPESGRRSDAETVAVQALAYLVSRPEDLDRFIALSGLDPATIRDSARDPTFLGGVLDHYLSDERLLVDFAGEIGAPPESIAAARHALDDDA